MYNKATRPAIITVNIMIIMLVIMIMLMLIITMCHVSTIYTCT